MKRISKIIDEIPPNGEWWKSDTRETFYEAAVTLLQKGFTDEEAKDLLEDLYSAVAAEYGD